MTNEQLQVLRMRLKSGEYDGAHIMQAWIAVDELIELREKIENIENCLVCAAIDDPFVVAETALGMIQNIET